MARKKVDAEPPVAPVVADSAAIVPEFPRYMYRADGTAEIFTSAEAFAAADDGKWAKNLLAFGIETAPGAK